MNRAKRRSERVRRRQRLERRALRLEDATFAAEFLRWEEHQISLMREQLVQYVNRVLPLPPGVRFAFVEVRP